MIWIVVGLTVLGLLVLFWWIGRRSAASVPNARRVFESQQSQLQQRFFEAASASGKPRGLLWKACEWSSLLEMAREKHTGHLTALVGVTIQFEAIPGSDMEGLPAVSNLRNASAVFFFHNGQWHTLGKAIFNLNPDEAIAHFGYERAEGKLTP
jgi:hypothetical protein